MGDFYGTGIEIWAGFGPVWQLSMPVFSCFHRQNNFLILIKDIVASTLNSFKISPFIKNLAKNRKGTRN